MESPKKLFTEKQISVSAFLGGPLPPGILVYKNLMRLNKEKEAYATMAATLIFTIGLAYTLIAVPDNIFEKIPSQLAPTIIGLIVWVLYHFLLSDLVKQELESGSQKESNWRVAGATIVGIVLYLGIAVGIGISQPPFPGEKIAFKGNEIYYDENTTKEDVKKLANQLFSIEYFSEEYPSVARLETWETQYIVTLPVSQDFWTDQGVLDELTSFKRLLEVEFGKDLTLTLEDYELNGTRITKSF